MDTPRRANPWSDALVLFGCAASILVLGSSVVVLNAHGRAARTAIEMPPPPVETEVAHVTSRPVAPEEAQGRRWLPILPPIALEEAPSGN